MADEINVGDLVVQIHDCCTQAALGTIGTVTRIYWSTNVCEVCGGQYVGWVAHDTSAWAPDEASPLHWLRRIDPLSEPESVERHEELPA